MSTMCFSTELKTSLKIEKCQKNLEIDKYSHILPRVCLFPMTYSKMNLLTNLKHFTYPGHFHTTPSSIFRPTLSYSTFFTDMLVETSHSNSARFCINLLRVCDCFLSQNLKVCWKTKQIKTMNETTNESYYCLL